MSDLWEAGVAPSQYIANILQDDSGLDLTTVTAAVFKVYKPGGTVVSWTATISGATTTQLTLTHTFASVTELDVVGNYIIYAILTVPTGFFATESISKPVYPRFGVH